MLPLEGVDAIRVEPKPGNAGKMKRIQVLEKKASWEIWLLFKVVSSVI
jgi:hypothetical protein